MPATHSRSSSSPALSLLPSSSSYLHPLSPSSIFIIHLHHPSSSSILKPSAIVLNLHPPSNPSYPTILQPSRCSRRLQQAALTRHGPYGSLAAADPDPDCRPASPALSFLGSSGAPAGWSQRGLGSSLASWKARHQKDTKCLRGLQHILVCFPPSNCSRLCC
jgi:hypothetical protein